MEGARRSLKSWYHLARDLIPFSQAARAAPLHCRIRLLAYFLAERRMGASAGSNNGRVRGPPYRLSHPSDPTRGFSEYYENAPSQPLTRPGVSVRSEERTRFVKRVDGRSALSALLLIHRE